MYLQCQTSQRTVIYSCRVTSTRSVILTTPLNPAPSLQRAEPSGNIHHTVQAPKKIPCAHLSAVTHPKTFLEKKKKSTDLHVAQVGNGHDPHFRDIVPARRTKQMGTRNCAAVCNLSTWSQASGKTCSTLLELSLHQTDK